MHVELFLIKQLTIFFCSVYRYFAKCYHSQDRRVSCGIVFVRKQGDISVNTQYEQ